MTTPSGTAAGPVSGTADLHLVRRALNGEPAAVEEVVGRLSCVVRFVFRLNRSLGYGLPVESLEDVVQQVYASLWPRLSNFAGSAALESWVFGFCRNCLRSEVRRRAGQLRALAPGEPGQVAAPERVLAHREGLEALRDELDRLAPVERRVVELRHLESWSFERIARHLGEPASTVKDRCYRTLIKMRNRLRRRDVSA